MADVYKSRERVAFTLASVLWQIVAHNSYHLG
jgi:hypothetical protein